MHMLVYMYICATVKVVKRRVKLQVGIRDLYLCTVCVCSMYCNLCVKRSRSLICPILNHFPIVEGKVRASLANLFSAFLYMYLQLCVSVAERIFNLMLVVKSLNSPSAV